MDLLCAVCLFIGDVETQGAVTVVNGQAVCQEHFHTVADIYTTTHGPLSMVAIWNREH